MPKEELFTHLWYSMQTITSVSVAQRIYSGVMSCRYVTLMGSRRVRTPGKNHPEHDVVLKWTAKHSLLFTCYMPISSQRLHHSELYIVMRYVEISNKCEQNQTSWSRIICEALPQGYFIVCYVWAVVITHLTRTPSSQHTYICSYGKLINIYALGWWNQMACTMALFIH